MINQTMPGKNIKWPLLIPFLTIAALPIVFCIWDSDDFIMRSLLEALCFEIKGEWGYVFVPVPVVLCLPVGVIGLIMNLKMKQFRVATVILSMVNIGEFLLLILFYCVLYILSGALQ